MTYAALELLAADRGTRVRIVTRSGTVTAGTLLDAVVHVDQSSPWLGTLLDALVIGTDPGPIIVPWDAVDTLTVLPPTPPHPSAR